MLLAARFSFVVYLFSRFALSACSSTGNIWRMAWGHGECGWCDNGKYTITSTVVATCYPLPPSPPHTHPSACLPASIYLCLSMYLCICVCVHHTKGDILMIIFAGGPSARGREQHGGLWFLYSVYSCRFFLRVKPVYRCYHRQLQHPQEKSK